MQDFIAVDFETATSNKMACQIGVTIVENGVIKGTVMDYIQPPDNKYEIGCMNIHHITPETTANASTFDVIWQNYKELFENYPVVAHNAPFDESVLRANLDYYGIPHNNINKFICTYQIYQLSLDKLCWAFDLQDDEHHDAGFDSLRCAQFYIFYLQGIQPDLSKLATYIPEGERKFIQHQQLKGDVLKKEGYNQEFMIGSDGKFAGRSSYFHGHGDYNVFDYYTAIDRGYIDSDYRVWWGYEDEKLFEYAKSEIIDLANDEKPFNFTMLTVALLSWMAMI